MRNVGDKIPPRALQSPDLGDVVQDHDRARGRAFERNRRGSDGEAARPDRSHDNLSMDRFAARQGLLDHGKQIRMPDQFHHRTPFTGHIRNARIPAESAVAVDHPLIAADHRDAFLHAGQHRRRPVPLFGQRLNRAIQLHGRLPESVWTDWASSSLLRSSGSGRKSPSATRLRKFLEPPDAARDRAKEKQRNTAGHNQDHQRDTPETAAKSKSRFLETMQRHGQSYDHGRRIFKLIALAQGIQDPL